MPILASKRAAGLLTGVLALVQVAAYPTPAEAANPAPEVRSIISSPLVFLGDFNVPGPRFYLLLAQVNQERGLVDVVMSVYDAGPVPLTRTRNLYTAEVPLSALTLSSNFRVATFDAEVAPIGRVLVQLAFFGPLGDYPATDGFMSRTWGYVYTSSSGKVSPCGDAFFSGSIGDEPISSSLCPAFATDIVEGVWYDTGLGSGI